MSDLQDKYKERWSDRRKKGYDWKKLAIMGLALVALLILINRLGRAGNAPAAPSADVIATTAVAPDSLSGKP